MFNRIIITHVQTMLKTTNTRTKHTQIISKGWLVYINIFLVHLAMYVPPDVLKVHKINSKSNGLRTLPCLKLMITVKGSEG